MAVPFSMNKTVGVHQVQAFRLRIKTTTTDILYGEINSVNWNPSETNLVVNFIVPDSILRKLIIGNFYKVQLAYVDKDSIVGYYSTIGIVKYTAKPRVEISGFVNTSTNIHRTEYIGIYHSVNDPSEKAYQYKFTLYNNSDEELESSGWLLHNSYEDTELDESSDYYTVKYALEENVTYRLQYSVMTNNNLEVASPRYLVMQSNSIDPEIKASLEAILDYDNGCINLKLVGHKGPNGEEYAASGAFLLTRASSVDNYSTWLSVSQFRLTGELPSQFLFRDHTIESGATYRYSLQQFNDAGIYSNRILAPDVKAQFEDIFLFDGDRQLKVRFNPKVTSFKTVLLETKKNTIGNKYPFIFRNGAVAYKEFPISGLLSYMVDNDEFFASKKDDFGYEKWENTTDVDDENITLERYFKLEVLNWLNDGKVKLFKSPQEGNYLVRLMNVSLSPIDTVSRMLHNFTCTASEVAAFTTENLAAYNLLKLEDINQKQMRWATLVLADMQITGDRLLEQLKKKHDDGFISNEEYLYDQQNIKDNYLIYERDLLKGYGTYHLKFTDFTQGTTFTFTNASNETQEIMIGVTGQYEIILDEPIYNLQLMDTDNRTFINPDTGKLEELRNPRYYQPGSITYGIMSTAQNRFDTVNGIDVRDITIHQMFGPNDNLLSDIVDLKHTISRMYFARFTKLDVQPVYDARFGINGKTMESIQLSTDNMYAITYLNDSNDLQNYYYRYEYPGKLVAMRHYETVDQPVELLSEFCYYYERNQDGTYNYYSLRGENLILHEEDMGNIQDTKYNNLSPYIIYDKQIKQDDGSVEHTYYTYADGKVSQITNYSTEIQYGNVILDVGTTGVISFEELSVIPDVVKIGAGVSAELSMQVKTLTYSVEENCELEKNAYENARQEYSMYVLGLKRLVDKSTMTQDGTYFYWENDVFVKIQEYEIDEYKNRTQSVYIPQLRGEVWSPLLIQQKYNAYVQARKTYMNVLDKAIKEKEEELPV